MKIAVIGVGHMGSWLARTLAKDNDVAVYDVDKAKVKKLDHVTVLHDLSALSGFKPELLIDAVGIRQTVNVFKSLEGYLTKDCVLCDVASVKGDIPDYYKGSGFKFASVHPMFGPTFADIQSLKDENAVLITESDPKIKEFFKKLFVSLELKIFELSFDDHDKMIAYSLTLPFASTMVFAACMESSAVPGTTFKKHLAIAKGLLSEDDYLLADILFNKYSVKEIDKVTSRLEFIKHVIKGRDYEEAVKFFNKLRDNVKH
jgi:prephenate dehydrogenase